MKDSVCILSIIVASYSLSGQAINVQKPRLVFSPSTPHSIKHQIQYLLGTHEKNGVWKYLEIPISTKPLHSFNFTFMMDKVFIKDCDLEAEGSIPD